MALASFSDYLRVAADAMANRCLSFDLAAKDNSSMLAHVGCEDANKLPYICEPSCKTASCPATCVKNVDKICL